MSWLRRKNGKTLRSVQVYGLFGGNKDNKKDDDTASKVKLTSCESLATLFLIFCLYNQVLLLLYSHNNISMIYISCVYHIQRQVYRKY